MLEFGSVVVFAEVLAKVAFLGLWIMTDCDWTDDALLICQDATGVKRNGAPETVASIVKAAPPPRGSLRPRWGSRGTFPAVNTSQPKISVVLSTLGNHHGLKRVLDGFTNQSIAPETFEVVVAVDVAESDGEAVDRAIGGERSYRVRRVSPEVPGLSANRNIGRRRAQGPLILFTDNDTIPAPSLLAQHLEWHRNEPDDYCAVVGNVRWSPEVEITTLMRWLDTGLQFNFANLSPGEVPWGAFAGANVSLKRAFVERIGDFEEERLPYLGEDTEFAYRASKLGMRLFYNPDARVDHLRTMSFELVVRRVRRMAAAEHELSQLHPELAPWWHDIFSDVSKQPRARGRGLRLARFVSPGLPWLGSRVWRSVDATYKQALAPHFLAAWEEATGGGDASQPDVRELLADGESGSEPGGPK